MIFANPMKRVSDIRKAEQYGIKKTTFDTVDELVKIKENNPDAECVIRLATETSIDGAFYNLSEKFGVPFDQVEEILLKAKELGVRIKGVAFHTGSGGVSFKEYEAAILNCKKIFRMA